MLHGHRMQNASIARCERGIVAIGDVDRVPRVFRSDKDHVTFLDQRSFYLTSMCQPVF